MPDDQGHPALNEIELGTVLTALADPTRRRVVKALLEDADGAERLCTSFGLQLSKATRSHHFRVLREAGLIRQVDRGNSRMAQLRRRDIEKCFPGLLELIARETN
ncbi:helix-turn-helix domain-containing protein [Variovorax humicola]|uniref:Helix-turn-helix domain-containing protein n=1 Tax=Variovorax humicola TaxID=1769758 RepID=A0ABU8VVB4_9BURK